MMRTDIYPSLIEGKCRAGEDLSWMDLQVMRDMYPQLSHVWDKLEDLPEDRKDVEAEYHGEIDRLKEELDQAHASTADIRSLAERIQSQVWDHVEKEPLEAELLDDLDVKEICDTVAELLTEIKFLEDIVK